MRGVHEGEVFNNYTFKLLEHDNDNKIVEVEYRGVWFMVDNGYLNWSCTIPPIKDGVTYKFIRFLNGSSP